MSSPLISVVILNYRRREELVRAIESARTQAYEPKEIVVVDNASGDGTAEHVAERFPDVRVLALAENGGCAGRNRGMEAARGEYVVTIDNDVRFDSPFELQKVAKAFEHQPEASVFVFKVLSDATGKLHLRDWCHPRSYLEWSETVFETPYLPEGACVFRRADFLALGGYYEPFRIGGEGWDLALRLIDSGRHMFYRPEIRVRHSMASETRSGRRPYYFYARNHIWTAFKVYSGLRRWRHLGYAALLMTYFSVKTRNVSDLYRGIRDGLGGLKDLPRTTVSRRGWRRLHELTSKKPGWFTRVRTHWAQKEI